MSQSLIDVTAFVNRLDDEIQLYEAMTQITRQELQAVESDDQSVAMLERVAQKQQLLGKIEKMESEIRPLKEGWNRLREHVADSQREQAEDKMRALRDTIKALIDLEGKWNASLQAEHAQTSTELKKLEQVRKTGAAYRTGSPNTGTYYMDRAK